MGDWFLGVPTSLYHPLTPNSPLTRSPLAKFARWFLIPVEPEARDRDEGPSVSEGQ